MGFEAVEAVRPLAVRAAQPVIDRKQALERKARRPSLTITAADDQSRVLQDFQVLRDSWLGQWRPIGKLEDTGLPGPQTLQDGAPGGIRKGCEGSAQFVFARHHR